MWPKYIHFKIVTIEMFINTFFLKKPMDRKTNLGVSGIALTTGLASSAIGSNIYAQQDNKNTDLRLIVDGVHSFKEDRKLIGGGLGVSYGPVGLVLNYSEAEDQIISEESIPLPNTLIPLPIVGQVIGREKEVDFSSLGAAIELHPGYFFLGGGANIETHTTMTQVSIVPPQGLSQGDTPTLDINEERKRQNSGRVYGGLEFHVGRFGLRAFAGCNIRKREVRELSKFGGVGMSFRLNRKQKRGI
jgi:hypothetical protein